MSVVRENFESQQQELRGSSAICFDLVVYWRTQQTGWRDLDSVPGVKIWKTKETENGFLDVVMLVPEAYESCFLQGHRWYSRGTFVLASGERYLTQRVGYQVDEKLRGS